MRFELDPTDAVYTWNRVGERPRKQLHRDCLAFYYEAKRLAYEQTGTPFTREHVYRFVNGWEYTRPSDEPEEAAGDRLRRLQEHAATFRAKGTNYYEGEIRPEVVETVARLRRHPRITARPDVLASHIEDCAQGYGRIIGDLHWRMVFSRGPNGEPGWDEVFHELSGRPKSEAVLFQTGLPTETTLMVRRMREMARMAQAHDRLMRLVEAGDADAINASSDPDVQRFAAKLRQLLKRFGLRVGHGWGAFTTFESPTWNVRPQIPLQMIASYAHSDIDDAEKREAAARRQRKTTLRKIRRPLDAEQTQRFDDALDRAMWSAWVMEDHNHLMDQASAGVLRDAIDLTGRALVRRGLITEADDVLHLSLDDIRTASSDLRRLVAEGKSIFAEQEAAGAPQTLGREPEPGSRRQLEIEDKGEGLVGGTLRGVPASPGRFTGVARVRMPAPGLPDIGENEILVAVDAGPDLTPVFAVLGAVVLDKGANWQHAAVMAREFGIPAVTGTVEGTSKIEDGATITVDGDAGVVEL